MVETVAVKSDGHAGLLALLEERLGQALPSGAAVDEPEREARSSADLQREVRRILALVAPGAAAVQRFQPPDRCAS